ncbi:hypothetical protein OC844_000379 [Tilletia horrida]|nr:hypothetical protein OC844_000379 [Tilletia horrida]
MPRHALALLCVVLALVLACWTPTAACLNILISNDDGFGSANIRALFATLLADEDHAVLIAAPVNNKSGTDGARQTPRVLDRDAEYGLAKKGDPAVGHEFNASHPDDRIWYVNSYPASSVEYGLANLAPAQFGGPPDLVVTGPNEGSNLGLAYLVSGTYGAARFAVQAGIPAIAFSAGNGTHRPYTDLGGEDDQAYTYARIAANIVQQLTKDGKPYLPKNTGLNVNFPSALGRDCSAGKERYVLTRLLGTIDPDPDTCTCGQSHTRRGCKLPIELDVSRNTDLGCTVTISVFEPSKWSPDASSTQQTVVLDKLKDILSCLP